MSNGSYHGDGVGVYCFASPPWDHYSPNDGWCMLELKVAPYLKKLKTGSQGRYVMKTVQDNEAYYGTPCPDCEVKAMLHRKDSLPSFLRYWVSELVDSLSQVLLIAQALSGFFDSLSQVLLIAQALSGFFVWSSVQLGWCGTAFTVTWRCARLARRCHASIYIYYISIVSIQ